MQSPSFFHRHRFSAPFGFALLAAAAQLGAQEVIVDDTDRVNAPAVGAWTMVSASIGNYGATYKRDSDPSAVQSNKPLKTLSFTPNIVTAGNYDVFVRTPKISAAASNVPISVTHARGTSEVKFNQRNFGGEWTLLGAYTFNAGKTGRITYSNAGTDGVVVADAVKLVRVVPIPSGAAPGKEIVVDNTDRVNVIRAGEWSTASGVGSYGGDEFLDAAVAAGGTKPAKSIQYSPSLTAGDYDISIWHSSSAQHDAKVTVSINTVSGVQLATLDQRLNGGQWVRIGRYSLAGGRLGSVTITNAGTAGIVSADAVRYLKAPDATDAAVFAAGLTAWRKPDFNGISCMECHGPTGYDIAVFNFNRDDLRRAVVPDHLTIPEADAIFAMIEYLRVTYPPAGGLKDIRTFRPLQPANGTLIGSDSETSMQQDAAFGQYLKANYRFAGPRVTTLEEAFQVQKELTSLDPTKVPIGIRLPLWSSAISRQGRGPHRGGSFNEWLPGLGLQAKPQYKAQWLALNDAYIANPTNENLYAMLKQLPGNSVMTDQGTPRESWFMFDAHNSFDGMGIGWGAVGLAQLKSNLLFQHDQLQRALGQPAILDRQDGFRLFGTNSNKVVRYKDEFSNPMWAVGDTVNFHISLLQIKPNANKIANTRLNPAALPRRTQGTSTDWILPLDESKRHHTTQRIAMPWFFMGWLYDNTLIHTDVNVGEYFDASMRPQDDVDPGNDDRLYVHRIYKAAVQAFKFQYLYDPHYGENPKWLPYTHFGDVTPAIKNPPGYPQYREDTMRMRTNILRSMLLLYLHRIKKDGVTYNQDVNNSFSKEFMINEQIRNKNFYRLKELDPAWETQDRALYNEVVRLVQELPLVGRRTSLTD